MVFKGCKTGRIQYVLPQSENSIFIRSSTKRQQFDKEQSNILDQVLLQSDKQISHSTH